MKLAKFALGAVLFLGAVFLELVPAQAKMLESPESIEHSEGKEKVSPPLDIASEMLEVDRRSRLVTFRGRVRAKQEELSIFSDELRAFYDEKGEQIERIIASGNVKINGKDISATAGQAEFFPPEGKIILSGNPEIWQGSDKLEGDEVIVFWGSERIMVKKARATVSPQRIYPAREED
ncbi:MAG: LptA/OstA family protein [Deltaproteobacteria bacterium]|nr:MAG: LptA/OstA family protein [Deltaproteobacteria bacterium]